MLPFNFIYQHLPFRSILDYLPTTTSIWRITRDTIHSSAYLKILLLVSCFFTAFPRTLVQFWKKLDFSRTCEHLFSLFAPNKSTRIEHPVTTEHRSEEEEEEEEEEVSLLSIVSEDDDDARSTHLCCAPEDYHEEEEHGGCYYSSSSSSSSFELLSTFPNTSWGGCGRAAAGSDCIDDDVTASNISSKSSDGSCCASDEISCCAGVGLPLLEGGEGEEECGRCRSTSTSSTIISIDDEARTMIDACSRSVDNEDDIVELTPHRFSSTARNTCVSSEALCPCCWAPELSSCNEDSSSSISMCGVESYTDHDVGRKSCELKNTGTTYSHTSTWTGGGCTPSSGPYAPSLYPMESGILRLDSGFCRMESRITMDILIMDEEDHVVELDDTEDEGIADCMEEHPIEDGDGRTVEKNEVEQKWSCGAESGRCDEMALQKSSRNSSGLVKEESIRSDAHGYSLHIAAREGSVASILALLDAGFHVDVEDNNGRTPLHEAAQYCKVDAVKVLICAGCEIDHADVLGSTPLFFADPEIIPILIEAGANIEHINYGNCTALEAAVYNDEPECVSALLAEMCDDSSSRDVDEQHKRSLAGALSIAAQKGLLEVFKLLLEVSTSLEDNTSALHAAAKHGHEKVVKALLDHGVLIDGVDENECTALHLACMKGHVAVSALLCSHGAACKLKNAKGKTALDIAVETGHIPVVSIVAKYQLSTRVKRLRAASVDGTTKDALSLWHEKAAHISFPKVSFQAPGLGFSHIRSMPESAYHRGRQDHVYSLPISHQFLDPSAGIASLADRTYRDESRLNFNEGSWW